MLNPKIWMFFHVVSIQNPKFPMFLSYFLLFCLLSFCFCLGGKKISFGSSHLVLLAYGCMLWTCSMHFIASIVVLVGKKFCLAFFVWFFLFMDVFFEHVKFALLFLLLFKREESLAWLFSLCLSCSWTRVLNMLNVLLSFVKTCLTLSVC